MSVSKVWELGGSAFNGLDRIHSLIKAATVDDVQPAAVLAAEALGSTLIVSDRLIGRAVDALGGSDSFRLQNVQLQLGLSAGGIAAEIRKSSSATKTFLLITVLKLHLDAEEIGDFLFEMLSKSEQLHMPSVSPRQLTSLVDAVAGHAQKLLASERIPEMILNPFLDTVVASGRVGSCSNWFRPLSADEALLLSRAFRALHQEDIGHVELEGSHGAIWIYLILRWLCPHDVGVLYDQSFVGGNPSGTIHIEILAGESRRWKIQEWHRSGNLMGSLAVDDDQTSIRLPSAGHISRDLMYALWLCQDATAVKVLGEVGEIAAGLTLSALNELNLDAASSMSGFVYHVDWKLPLGDFCRSTFAVEINALIRSFGWPSSPDPDRVETIHQKLVSVIRSKGGSKSIVTLLRDNLSGNYESCQGFTTGADDCKDCFLNRAFSLASTLVSEATVDDQGLPRSLPSERFLCSHSDSSYMLKKNWLLQALGQGSIAVEDYLSQSSGLLWPMNRRIFVERPIAASHGGLIVYPKVLQTFSTDRREVLALSVRAGHILWKGERYQNLYEYAPRSSRLSRIRKEDILSVSGGEDEYLERKEIRLETQLARHRPNLRLCWSLVALDNRALPRHVPYPSLLYAQKILAMIHVVPRSFGASTASVGTLRDLGREGIAKLLKELRKITPLESTAEANQGPFRAVMTYTGQPEVDFLRNSYPGTRNLPTLLQGSTSMLDCVAYAEATFGDRWLIFSSP
ncbi:MAG: hypothetical protein M1817_005348 [Caeruleum heppii]|nr:MAG: hypothetical protein M1817_005348 [Caeruleum heppii]